MKSYSNYATGPVYDPVNYFYKYNRALVFFRTMLLKRQRVLLVSSIESNLRISGPFSHLFLTSACDRRRALQIIEKFQKKLSIFWCFLMCYIIIESTQQQFFFQGLKNEYKNILLIKKQMDTCPRSIQLPELYNYHTLDILMMYRSIGFKIKCYI